MTSTLQKYGAAIIWIITAIVIIATAYFGKDTKYENAWFYVLAAGSILAGFFEMYARRKDKDKN